ncbi:hypothetical protein JCM11251_005597 [Rhodosporidiobolus azoricus]
MFASWSLASPRHSYPQGEQTQDFRGVRAFIAVDGQPLTVYEKYEAGTTVMGCVEAQPGQAFEAVFYDPRKKAVKGREVSLLFGEKYVAESWSEASYVKDLAFSHPTIHFGSDALRMNGSTRYGQPIRDREAVSEEEEAQDAPQSAGTIRGKPGPVSRVIKKQQEKEKREKAKAKERERRVREKRYRYEYVNRKTDLTFEFRIRSSVYIDKIRNVVPAERVRDPAPKFLEEEGEVPVLTVLESDDSGDEAAVVELKRRKLDHQLEELGEVLSQDDFDDMGDDSSDAGDDSEEDGWFSAQRVRFDLAKSSPGRGQGRATRGSQARTAAAAAEAAAEAQAKAAAEQVAAKKAARAAEIAQEVAAADEALRLRVGEGEDHVDTDEEDDLYAGLSAAEATAMQEAAARRDALSALERLSVEFESRQSALSTPSSFSFHSASPSTPGVPYDESFVLSYQHHLASLRVKIDAIESRGDLLVKSARRELVKRVRAEVARLDDLKNTTREETRRESSEAEHAGGLDDSFFDDHSAAPSPSADSVLPLPASQLPSAKAPSPPGAAATRPTSVAELPAPPPSTAGNACPAAQAPSGESRLASNATQSTGLQVRNPSDFAAASSVAASFVSPEKDPDSRLSPAEIAVIPASTGIQSMQDADAAAPRPQTDITAVAVHSEKDPGEAEKEEKGTMIVSAAPRDEDEELSDDGVGDKEVEQLLRAVAAATGTSTARPDGVSLTPFSSHTSPIIDNLTSSTADTTPEVPMDVDSTPTSKDSTLPSVLPPPQEGQSIAQTSGLPSAPDVPLSGSTNDSAVTPKSSVSIVLPLPKDDPDLPLPSEREVADRVAWRRKRNAELAAYEDEDEKAVWKRIKLEEMEEKKVDLQRVRKEEEAKKQAAAAAAAEIAQYDWSQGI